MRSHYRTVGTPRRDGKGQARNAVLVLHGTGGAGGQFAAELLGAGQPLDASRYFVIMPDGIGDGQSSKPSDGLRAAFPRDGYEDMVRAQYRLATEGLGVARLRLVMGTSMGGMHTWLWGQRHPQAMDALMPLASQPDQISGRNRPWRRVAIDAIRSDPAWQQGTYTTHRVGCAPLRSCSGWPAATRSSGSRRRPTLAAADRVPDAYVDAYVKSATPTMCCTPSRRRATTIQPPASG